MNDQTVNNSVIFINDLEDKRLGAYLNIKERDLTGRQSRFIAEGKVVLRVLLNSAQFEAESLLISENKLAGLQDILSICPAHTPIYAVSAADMDQIAGFHVHRGILAVGIRKNPNNISELIDNLPEDAQMLILCGISNHDNIGSIFRNAAAFEAACVLLDETCCDPLYRKAIRVSVGATLQVPYAHSGKIDDIVKTVAEAGVNLIALSPQSTQSLYDMPVNGRTALLLGTEGEGLPNHLLSSLQTARIPMSRQFDSLNVATASGIALSCLSRSSFL
ncbi:TrmH family RNA methyltransferase [Pseudochrobactrum kiredjianiae]|uniref:TrmH family RNA methyltransferase n=1 Tax=Pseudochrobactrum kiredjianiae TaxID=386305 RepID=A0ABW3V399_9HYPH|nr:RNA methyltransferase [Pseudochrobactrum kiredjianiae]MDM7850987.1 RNA methyltransferase [Pseudochrobactrum kiredjianiae]